ncbi:MAG: zinc-ribbon domain-containing protein [Lachnospiraceae bacterium]|nr:zinc-ribbon domain-containing protein [Lachnospiraceae bacterium]
MKCKNCGAGLQDTDQFCASCGWKVIKERRCPECGTVLRDGMKFCHECGRLVGSGVGMAGSTVGNTEARATGGTAGSTVGNETLEIPIADIEKNILLETEHEIGAPIKKTRPVEKAKPVERAKPAEKRKPVKADPVPSKKKVKSELERPTREKVSRKRVYEEDWEDDEEEEYEENDHNIMTIVTVVMAFLIFAIAAFLIINMVRNKPIKDYGESIESVQEEGTEGDGSVTDGDAADGEQIGSVSAEGLEVVGILTIDSNVNVRDNPGTEGTNIIKVAKAGEMYQYCGQVEDGEWYVILLEDGSIGYVFKDYISVN